MVVPSNIKLAFGKGPFTKVIETQHFKNLLIVYFITYTSTYQTHIYIYIYMKTDTYI